MQNLINLIMFLDKRRDVKISLPDAETDQVK